MLPRCKARLFDLLVACSVCMLCVGNHFIVLFATSLGSQHPLLLEMVLFVTIKCGFAFSPIIFFFAVIATATATATRNFSRLWHGGFLVGFSRTRLVYLRLVPTQMGLEPMACGDRFNRFCRP